MHVIHWFKDNVSYCSHSGLASNKAIVVGGKLIHCNIAIIHVHALILETIIIYSHLKWKPVYKYFILSTIHNVIILFGRYVTGNL